MDTLYYPRICWVAEENPYYRVNAKRPPRQRIRSSRQPGQVAKGYTVLKEGTHDSSSAPVSATPARPVSQMGLRISNILPPSFGWLANHYINYELPFNKRNGQRKSKGTIYCYQHALDEFILPRWQDEVAARIRPLAIRDWFYALHDEDDYDWQTVSKVRMVMGQVFYHADLHDLET